MEEWKEIVGNRETYLVSNYGNVKTKSRICSRGYYVKEKYLCKQENNSGYLRCSMNIDGKSKMYFIHRLVAKLFLTNVDGNEFVNHIDGNKHNNNVDNLEWVTRSENEKHAWKIGLKSKNTVGTKCEKHGMSKLKQKDVDWIRKNHIPFDKEFGSKALACKFDVCPQTITNIVHNKNWN